MINVKAPNSLFLEQQEASHAILLLHSFTGTIRDVKLLAGKLHKVGYTCYVPAYEGHGLLLEDLLEYNTDDWLKTAQAGYRFLQEQGYQQISVCGVSLGGILSLKLAETTDVHSVVVMSTPFSKDDAGLEARLTYYCQRMGDLVGLSEEEITRQLTMIESYHAQLQKFKLLVDEVMANLEDITAPIAIKYGEQDEQSYAKSANYIYEHIKHNDKEISGYPHSKHLMTHGEGRPDVERDIIAFLEDYE